MSTPDTCPTPDWDTAWEQLRQIVQDHFDAGKPICSTHLTLVMVDLRREAFTPVRLWAAAQDQQHADALRTALTHQESA